LARSHPHLARSHPHLARSHPHLARSHPHLARSLQESDSCEDYEDATVFRSFLTLFGNYLVLRAEKIGAIVPDPSPSTFFQTSCVSLNHCQETIKNLCFFKRYYEET
jgi:hypothetical protein